MPKVNYGIDKELEIHKKNIIHVVEHCRSLCGGDMEVLATKLKMSVSTLRKRKRNPEKFTLEEMVDLYKVLKINFELPRVLIGG